MTLFLIRQHRHTVYPVFIFWPWEVVKVSCPWYIHSMVQMSVFVFLQLSRDCKVEVQRILHQRALDVKLDPELQKRCMTDLGKWCSEKTDAGQVRQIMTMSKESLTSLISLTDFRAPWFVPYVIMMVLFTPNQVGGCLECYCPLNSNVLYLFLSTSLICSVFF